MSLFETLEQTRSDDGIVWISFQVPGHSVNLLTPQVLAELAAALDRLESEAAADPLAAPTAVVLRSSRTSGFFAGADLDRLASLLEAAAAGEAAMLRDSLAAGRRVFARLTRQPWPSLAILHGQCLGGGLELALACDLRIAVDDEQTRLGFPEVKLGLLPGWGGTARLTRLIGPGPAVELVASGDTISAERAWRRGLVDACVTAERVEETARLLVSRMTSHDLLEKRRQATAAAVGLDAEERSFLEATAAAAIMARTGGHQPAPLTILQTILAGQSVSADEAAAIETDAFLGLARSPQPRHLLHVFRLGERNRRDDGLTASAAASLGATGSDALPAVDRTGIVGAGIMGAGITAKHLRSGIPVTLVDSSAEALRRGVPSILEEAAWSREHRRSDPQAALRLSGLLSSGTSLASLADAGLVIESVVEKLSAKQEVLTAIEGIVADEAVLATNTSTNPIARLAEPLRDPSRFCGMHFFNPVRRMQLVEIIRGPATSDRTVAFAVAHGKRLGKIPIVVRDSPGFLVNRLLMPYLHEAIELLREGVPVRTIDQAARRFGMPLGPIELYDMIGLDTAFYAGIVLYEAFGDRLDATPVLPALVKSGRLGCKSGGGFYRYGPTGQLLGPDPDAARLVATYAAEMPAGGPMSDPRQIAERLVLPMVLEATRALDEEIVRDPADIDLGVIHGLGFPAFRGGLLAWADSLGGDELLRRLEPLAPLGSRMHPTQRLLSMAREQTRFYSSQSFARC